MRFASTQFMQNDPYSVTVWDEDGKKTSTYNLADYKGNIDFSKLPKNHKYRPALEDLLRKAHADIEVQRTYEASRRRETNNENLRYAFALFFGRGGGTIYVDKSPTESCKIGGFRESDVLAEAIRLGIPVIDSRTIPDNLITKVVSYPMLADKPGKEDLPPYTSFSFAPIEIIAALYESLGATIHNVTPDYEGAKQVGGWTVKELTAYVGFTTGDNVMLSKAMDMN